MRKQILLLASCFAVASIAFAPGAGAKVVELHNFASSFDGHDAVGASTFGEGSLDKVAVDKATGDVYVGANNAIYKFDSSGVSQPFSGLAPNTVIGSGISEFGALTVDNSGGAHQGRIYAFPEYSALEAYEPTGASVSGGGFPIAAEGDECGAAVDASGHIWRHVFGGTVKEYDDNGEPTGTEFRLNLAGYCDFDMDAEGNFYRPASYAGGAIRKYNPTGTFLGEVDPTSTSQSVAIDRSNGDIYVDTQSTILHYTSAGGFVESFGSLHESHGVAVDSSTHAVYAIDDGSPTTVEKFAPTGPVTIADTSTEAATEVTRTGATLHGTLNPAGVTTTDCKFEYGTVASQGYSQSAPCAEGNTFSGTEDSAVSAAVSGLTPETEYHYRLVVTDANGASQSVAQTFETQAAVKETTTGEATGITWTEATLHGSFDPDGIETNYWFEYGAGFVLNKKVPLPAPPGGEGGSGTGTVEVSQVISGLEPSTSPAGKTYRYRLVAENSLGKTVGVTQSFNTLPAVKEVTTLPAGPFTTESITLNGSFNPNGEETHYYFQWGKTATYGNYAPVGPPGADGTGPAGVKTVSALISGLEVGVKYHYRLVAVSAHGTTFGADVTAVPSAQPTISLDRATEINTDTAVLEATVNPNSVETTYHWEYGLEDCSVATCQQTPETAIGKGTAGVPIRYPIEGLTPGTVYHFRLIATNALGTTVGDDHFFLTYLPESGGETCSNVLERQQTGASETRHCRAYELVSAANTGGYDVESNLIPGLRPLPGFPNAGGRVLYTVRFGSIPGSGDPPNRGGDPYLATRGADGWTTEYVGLQADGTASTVPFSSALLEADQSLDAFAFGGPETCDPCFADGSTNIPLRLPDGNLVKGMAGSENPTADPAGEVAKHFSADGRDFVFGSTSQFEPTGNDGSLTIYERNLGAGTTQVVSTNPDGTTMSGSGIAELDISRDGSRVLIGREVGSDADGNPLYDLYMHVGSDSHSVPVAEPAGGASYAGMTPDGSRVYFTTTANLGDDSDSGADLFRADVSASGATVTRVSTGSAGSGNADSCDPVPNAHGDHWNEPGASSAATCGVVAIGGGAGVASQSGAVYFLSPENLDSGSAAIPDQPNLYVAEIGSAPEFIATLGPDNPAVLDGVAAPGKRETADFQVTPNGKFAAFNGTGLTENTTVGHTEIYRSEIGGQLVCVSCLPSNGAPSTDTELTAGGLNLVNDGRVFFTTAEQLILRDTNQLKDAYEWDEGQVGIISTGLDSNDSGLLTASADGKDVFFFTRQSLAPQDENGGAMKIYDAREGGGFLYNPPPRPCVASDECHGPGTQQPPAPAINTIEGTGEPQPPIRSGAKRVHCHKGFVKRHGKCVKHRKHSGHRRRHKQKHRGKRHGGGKERHRG